MCVCVCAQIRGGQEAVEWYAKRDALCIWSLVCSDAPQRCQDAQTLNTAFPSVASCPDALRPPVPSSVHGVKGHLHDYSLTQEETKQLSNKCVFIYF